MLESGVKLGVLSRGSGNVTKTVTTLFPILKLLQWTLLHNPRSGAYFHSSTYEHLMNAPGGYKAYELAQATKEDPASPKYLKESDPT